MSATKDAPTWRAIEHGIEFLEEIRKIYSSTSRLSTPGRAARATAFSICYKINKDNDLDDPKYELYVRTENGDLEPVVFSHHEL